MKKPTTKPKKYMVLVSACGSMEQAKFSEYGAGLDFFATPERARAEVPSIMADYEDNEGDKIKAAWVVEIVSSGKPTGMTWD